MGMQLRHEELEELKVIPCVKSAYWDLRKQRLSLAPLLTACPVNPDKECTLHMAGVASDVVSRNCSHKHIWQYTMRASHSHATGRH